jgi:hypothetical protein
MEAAGGVPRAGVNWRPGATAYETIVTFARYVNIANDDAPAENWPSSDAYWVATKSKAGQAVGFGTVSQYSAGLMPANLSNLDDATATRMGMKAYYHGTTYAGGNAPTVTGNNSWATTRAMFIPKQMQDGRWVLEFQIRGSVSGGALVTSNASINGIVTKNTTDFNQSLNANSGNGSFNAVAAGMAPNNNQIIFRHSSITPTEYYVSGLIELESKPTWAY